MAEDINEYNKRKWQELKELIEAMKITGDLTPVAIFTLTKFVDQLIEENEKQEPKS